MTSERRGRCCATLAAAAFLAAAFAAPVTHVTAHAERRSETQLFQDSAASRSSLAALPLAFVENGGQSDERVRYYARGPRFGFYFTRDAIVMAFLQHAASGSAADGYAVRMRFVGSAATTVVSGDGREGSVNYIHGADPAAWHTSVAAYNAVVYRDLWPGVDLHVRGRSGTLKYEFHVAPGADTANVRLAYDGARSLTVDGDGGLRIDTAMGVLRDAPPVSYQDFGNRRVPVASRYALAGDRSQVALEVGAYDRQRDLVIDPGIEYTTFLGGNSDEQPGGIAVDAAGNVYIVGTTQSPDFPTTAGAFRRTGAPSNVSDVFVTKVNPTGTALVYSTFIGGSDFDFGRRIAVDASGNAYVTGQTKSSNFPTTAGAFDRTFNILSCPRCGIDQYDAFVFKLNPSGSGLVYSTFLGGTDYDDPRGIAIDAGGNAYVTGDTTSIDFPTTAGSYQPASHGSYDMFVTKLNAAGSALVYSTYIGGSNVDNGERIAVDAGGRAVVLGFSSSSDFPTTPGAYDTTPNGGFDITVTKLNAAGSGLVFSTVLGGQGMEGAGGLALDTAANVYVSGGTGSLDFPTTPGAFDTTPDGSDAFVAKLDATGSRLLWSTVVGGSNSDGAAGVAPDANGNVWITGITGSTDFPVTADAFRRTLKGGPDAFVAKLTADGATLQYATLIGGVNSEGGDDIAVGANGAVYIVGHTYSLDFPATTGAFDTVFNGDPSIFWGDTWVTKIDPNRTASTPPASAPVPAAPSLLSPPNGDTPSQPIGLDWNDVTSAASYEVQIDDSSGFTAPLVRDATVTTSSYATTGLATVTHFWRVRAFNVDGVAGAWSSVRSFTPQTAPPPATLSTMSTSPTSVVGGNSASATVVLSVGAPDGGAVVSLSSSDPSIASVPPSVSIPANGFTGTFAITTSPVTANTSVTITASYNATTRTATLAVTNAATPSNLQSLVLSPSSTTGGNTAQGVVFLTDAAPAGGAAVSLASSSPGIAGVPASVTVAAGATNAVFNVPTSAVTSSTPVTISATYAGASRSATLTVTPPAPPPQTAALTLSVSGRSGVHVTTTPAGLDVVSGSSGSASFTVGTSITLSIGSGRDAIFSGACATSGKVKSCTFTLNGASSVSVNVQ